MAIIEAGYKGAPADLIDYGPEKLVIHAGFDQKWPGERATPDLQVKEVEALIDTGATGLVFDDKLYDWLKGVLPLRDPSASPGMREYKAHFHIPLLGYSSSVRAAFRPLIKNGLGRDILVGRDCLRDFRLTYDGSTGSTTIEWPIPRSAQDVGASDL